MSGFALFLILFIAASGLVFVERTNLDTQSQALTKMGACMMVAQGFYEAKNSKIIWSGSVDWNYYVSGNTVYVDYSADTPFNGIYCETLDTNLTTIILRGDVNIAYDKKSGFSIRQ
jgi:hypothetical protein